MEVQRKVAAALEKNKTKIHKWTRQRTEFKKKKGLQKAGTTKRYVGTQCVQENLWGVRVLTTTYKAMTVIEQVQETTSQLSSFVHNGRGGDGAANADHGRIPKVSNSTRWLRQKGTTAKGRLKLG